MFEDLSPDQKEDKAKQCPAIFYRPASDQWSVSVSHGKGRVRGARAYDTFEEAVWAAWEIAELWRLPVSNADLFGDVASLVHGHVRSGPERSTKTGVCWCRSAGKWKAQILHEGFPRHLGWFTDYPAAVQARLAAEDGLP